MWVVVEGAELVAMPTDEGPLPDSVILWTRLIPEEQLADDVDVELEIATHQEFSEIVKRAGQDGGRPTIGSVPSRRNRRNYYRILHVQSDACRGQC